MDRQRKNLRQVGHLGPNRGRVGPVGCFPDSTNVGTDVHHVRAAGRRHVDATPREPMGVHWLALRVIELGASLSSAKQASTTATVVRNVVRRPARDTWDTFLVSSREEF